MLSLKASHLAFFQAHLLLTFFFFHLHCVFVNAIYIPLNDLKLLFINLLFLFPPHCSFLVYLSFVLAWCVCVCVRERERESYNSVIYKLNLDDSSSTVLSKIEISDKSQYYATFTVARDFSKWLFTSFVCFKCSQEMNEKQ